ncbi:unnamed protein product [Closterium sp. NIES-54]
MRTYAFHSLPFGFEFDKRTYAFRSLPFGFEFDKRTYAFRSLPFGLATAPFVFTQLIKQLARRWQEQGIRVIPYVDDILFLCQSKAHAQAICKRVILDLKEAGFVINAKKSQLSPSQRLRFLGVDLETDTGRFSIGPDRRASLHSTIQNLLSASSACQLVPVRHMARIHGMLASMGVALGATACAFSHAMLQVINDAPSWKSSVVIPLFAATELHFWLEEFDQFNGAPFHASKHSWHKPSYSRSLGELQLGTHSFRKGAATVAANTGVPDRVFKRLGRWRSDTAKEMRGGAEPGGTESGGAEPGGTGSARVASRGASSRRKVLSPQELREWFARRWGCAAGAGGTTAAAGPGGTAEAAGVGPTGGSAGASGGTGAAGSAGTGAAGAIGVGATGGVGAGGTADAGTSEGARAGAAGAGGATGAGAPAGSPGAVPAGSGGTTRPRPYFVSLLEQVLGLPPSPGPAPPFECPQPVQSQSLLQPVSPLPAPSPYTGPTEGLAERRAPASRPASPARPACTSRRTSRPRPPAVPGTHQMAVRPSTAPLRVSLPSPPASSLRVLADPESDSLRDASPTVARFLATVVTDPSLASTAASALVAELVDFAARCRLDYAARLVAESASVCPPSVGGECALSTDVLEDRQEEFQCFAAALPHLVSTLLAPEGDLDAPDIPTPRSYAEAIEGPYSSQWQAAMDAEMASWKSTGTYVDEVPPPGANIATKWSSQGYTFSLGSGSVSWRSTRSSSVLSSSCEAEIYAGAMAAQELRWLTYLLTGLGEQPRSPPVLYVDNKAMLALCREHRLEHRTKHIALRYFFARELQQRGQLRLAYVASQANTADIFTKALPPGDHQHFCTMLVKRRSYLQDGHVLESLVGQSLHAPGYPGAPGVPLLVRDARRQRKLQQPEQQIQNMIQVIRRMMLNLWKKKQHPKKQQEQKKQGKEKQQPQPAPGQGGGKLGDTSNDAFPDVVGMTGAEARKYFQASAPHWNVAIIPSGAMITGDFQEDRVRVFVDKAGIVQRTQVG